MNMFRRLRMVQQAFRQLGPSSLVHYLRYRTALHMGSLRRQTPAVQDPWLHRVSLSERQVRQLTLQSILPLPPPAALRDTAGDNGSLTAEADQIAGGRIRIFGQTDVPLDLAPESGLYHWTEFERGRRSWGAEDVKWIWEPARFGWAFQLGRAYHLTNRPRYAQVFWRYLERFLDTNPAYLGPHWASAQEVALRLTALTFAFHTMGTAEESTPERLSRLGWAIACHARRIPSTLSYARAQNNNHLLTEAMGLYTTGLVLPNHPKARRWRSLGWRWFHRGIATQIAEDGTYIQHSMNYHRLMLQASLWMAALAHAAGDTFPAASRRRLAAATRWALALTDTESGRAPNLGPNDGALILPLSSLASDDYRPTLQAAVGMFLGEPAFPPGPWDETALWLGGGSNTPPPDKMTPRSAGAAAPCCVIRNEPSGSWGYFRVPSFTGRPGHADVLHLDLWWRGLNVALDAGTYSYNSAAPWEHALAHTGVHNTVAVAGQDQMTRAGKFLWLNWAKSTVLSQDQGSDGRLARLTASHNGYRALGIRHQRTVQACPDGRWEIEDRLEGSGRSRQENHQTAPAMRLHWLLPDWPHEARTDGNLTSLRLQTPAGWIGLKVEAVGDGTARAELFRAGQHIWGTQGSPDPTRGWKAPTYGKKEPALSLSVEIEQATPVVFRSEWVLG